MGASPHNGGALPGLFRFYLTFPWGPFRMVGAMLMQLALALGFLIGARVVVDTANLRVLVFTLTALGGVFGHILAILDRALDDHTPPDVLFRFANDVAVIEAHALLAPPSVVLLLGTDWRHAIACTLSSPLVLLGPRLFRRRVGGRY